MAENELKVRLRSACKPLSQWESENPIPKDGEVCYVKENGNYKIGNGSDNFKALPWGQADTATKAFQDSMGQQINMTYIKGLSVSGRVITYTKGNGDTGTITTQDTTYSTGTNSSEGLTKLYTSKGTSIDGTMTRNAITIELNKLQANIDNKPSIKIVRWN